MQIPQRAPGWTEAIETFLNAGKSYGGDSPSDRADAMSKEVARGPAPDGKYRHWHTLRLISPPEHLTAEEVWAARKIARATQYRRLPLVDADGAPFQYALVDPILERLHNVDRDAAGQIVLPEPTATPGVRDQYITRSLMEEAITSSQLEGAATTRAVAKQMLRSGRPPRDLSEQMILNNYRAMELVRDRKDESLSQELVEEIQQVVTRKTGAEARYRTLGDGIGVYDDQNRLLHSPPPVDQIAERMAKLCQFANETETGVFLHPVLKSIILHFWMAFDHPFVDGNGRTARALFYWSMLKEGFWLAEFLSVSAVLKRGPARYAESFLYTETDENDMTYFMLAQLRAVEQAVGELKRHLAKRARELRATEALLGPNSAFNHRQRSILGHALRHPDAVLDIQSEKARHGVAYATARADLLDLAGKGLLSMDQQGRKYVFRVPADLSQRVASGEEE